MYEWESELPALAELSDEAAAEAINAMTKPNPQLVFGSFRTLSAILTELEYDILRNTLDSLAAGSRLIADSVAMLSIPGNERGDGGGQAFNDHTFVTKLTQLAAVPGLENVPAKVAAYVASVAPPLPEYQPIDASAVGIARGTRPAVQMEVTLDA